MGAFSVELDPDGYYWASERGFHMKATGADLWAKTVRPAGATALANITKSSLYNPPGSEWLMMRPLQLCDTYFSPEASGHAEATYQTDEIVVADDVVLKEFDMALKPGEAAPTNPDYWQTIQRTPDSITSLDGVDYSAIAAAISTALPSGIGTVAFAQNTPDYVADPHPLAEGDFTPCLRWLSSPWPDTTFVFGFANFAFVITNEVCHVLRSPNNNKATWELLAQVKAGEAPSPGQPHSERRSGQSSMLSIPAVYGIPMMLVVYPSGPDSIYVHFGSAVPVRIQVLKPETSLHSERLFPGGHFWLGMGPKRKLTFQLQCVSYWGPGAGLDGVQGEGYLFKLDEGYKPTADPLFTLQIRHQQFSGFGSVLSGSGSGPLSDTSTGGQKVDWTLLDEAGDAWVSDGTHSASYLQLLLTPGSILPAQTDTFLAPQVRGFQLRFPPVLTERVNSPLTLTDYQVASWSAEAGMHDPDSKRVEIVLTPEAGDLLLGAGYHDSRTNYPVHIVEGGIIRVRAWVQATDLEELYVEDEIARPIALRGYKINGKALLSRADCGWLYLPELVHPDAADGGYIEHTFVVSEVLNGVGFDTSDTDQYLAAVDELAGTGLAQLPGTWATTMGTNGQDDEGAWNPGYSQQRLEYLNALTVEFRGWRLYEALNGLIRYHADPVFWFGLGGRSYYFAAEIHRTSAEAAAAGVPGQYMLAQPTRTIIPPVGNHLRVSGKGDDAEAFPHVIESDPTCWLNLDAPDFTGEPIPVAYVSKLAVDPLKVSALARIALQFTKHRAHLWHVAVPLAPWEFNAGGHTVELGDVIRLAGDSRPDGWVRHMEVFCQARNHYVTMLTLQRMPADNFPVLVGACTGGTPFPGACLIS